MGLPHGSLSSGFSESGVSAILGSRRIEDRVSGILERRCKSQGQRIQKIYLYWKSKDYESMWRYLKTRLSSTSVRERLKEPNEASSSLRDSIYSSS